MISLALDGVTISLEDSLGVVQYIDICKDNVTITVNPKYDNFITNSLSEESHWWSEDNDESKDEYLLQFPEYDTFAQLIGSSTRHVMEFLRGLDTYQSLLNTPYHPASEILNYDTLHVDVLHHSMTMFIFNDNRLIAIEGTDWRLGDYEYVNCNGMSLFNDIDVQVANAHLYRRILAHQPTIEDVRLLIKVCSADDVLQQFVSVLESHDFGLDASIESPSVNSPYVCVQCNGLKHVVLPCVMLVRKNQWDSILYLMDTFPSKFKYYIEMSRRSVYVDVPSIIADCKVIHDLTPDMIVLLHQISNSTLISMVERKLENLTLLKSVYSKR